MLQVQIGNIDFTYLGVFDTDDETIAAGMATNCLIKSHGFFKDNVAHKCPPPNHNPEPFWGILLMRDEVADEIINKINTYLITIKKFEPNTMIQTI